MKAPRGIAVLEGADRAGKTTLARALLRRTGGRYLHGRVWREMWRWHVAMTRLALRWADEGFVVIDRLWLSELIYGPAYRGGAAYDLGARCLERVLARAGTVTVLCAPVDQEAQLADHARHRAAGAEAFADVRRVVAAYADLRHGNLAVPGDGYLAQLTRFGDFVTRRRDVLVYDRYEHDVERAADAVLARSRLLRGAQVPGALDSRRTNVAGFAGTARWLLVGEAPSPRVAREGLPTRWPWTDRDGHLSAATHLNRAIHSLGLAEPDLAFTNAVDPDDQLSELLARSPARPIALGGVADRRLRELGSMGHAVLPHPQWHRRFRARRPPDYAALLREAL